MDNIASTLKQLRKNNNISMEQVIQKLNDYGIQISSKTLYGYENNVSKAPANTVMALAMIYGVGNVLETFGYMSKEPEQQNYDTEPDTTEISQDALEVAKRYDRSDNKTQNIIRMTLDMDLKKEDLMANFDEFNKKIS